MMAPRELLWLAVAVLAGYAAWQFLLALRGGAERRSGRDPGAATGAAPDEGDDDDHVDYAPVLRKDLGAQPAAVAAPAQAGVDDERFRLQLENQHLQRQLAALEGVVARQQEEIANLLADIDDLSARQSYELIQPGSSPEYSEALVLARQGLNAGMIAERCGITLAEAELVLVVAKGAGGQS
ncbi:DUF2802 domain-containing protein [Thauera mechernichensis]